MNKPPILTVTSSAEEQIYSLIKNRGKLSTEGIRVSVNSKGCSGHSYQLEFADEIQPKDEIVQLSETKILIDPKALIFLIGTELDFVEENFKSGFVFRNPNLKTQCSCGKSFNI